MCSGAHELAASFKYTPLFVSMNPVLIIAIEICVAVVLPTVWRSSGCTVDLSVCRRQGKHRIKIQCITAAHARTDARTHVHTHARTHTHTHTRTHVCTYERTHIRTHTHTHTHTHASTHARARINAVFLKYGNIPVHK